MRLGYCLIRLRCPVSAAWPWAYVVPLQDPHTEVIQKHEIQIFGQKTRYVTHLVSV